MWSPHSACVVSVCELNWLPVVQVFVATLRCQSCFATKTIRSEVMGRCRYTISLAIMWKVSVTRSIRFQPAISFNTSTETFMSIRSVLFWEKNCSLYPGAQCSRTCCKVDYGVLCMVQWNGIEYIILKKNSPETSSEMQSSNDCALIQLEKFEGNV